MLARHRSGSGPPLVLLHGVGLDRHCWAPVLPALERARDVVALDLPGFGESPPLPREPAIGALADAVEATLRALGLDRPHVAGNSLGGAIALELGARDVVASVCALSPAGLSAGRERSYEQASLFLTRRLARLLDPVAEPAFAGPVRRTLLMAQMTARPWGIPPAAAAQMCRATARGPGFDATVPQLARWRPAAPACPTTIAWGQRDRLLLCSRQAPRARRVLPAARHLILRGCGHVPMWDDPDQVARVILEAGAGG